MSHIKTHGIAEYNAGKMNIKKNKEVCRWIFKYKWTFPGLKPTVKCIKKLQQNWSYMLGGFVKYSGFVFSGLHFLVICKVSRCCYLFFFCQNSLHSIQSVWSASVLENGYSYWSKSRSLLQWACEEVLSRDWIKFASYILPISFWRLIMVTIA